MMSVGLQDASTQVAALVEMAVRLGPHWQPWSVRAQPAATMADVRQGICARLESWGCRLLGGGQHHTAQEGSPERFWATATPAAAARTKTAFIVGGVVRGGG